MVGDLMPGRMGAGLVHHIAFHAASDSDEAAMADRLRQDLGIETTEQKDRCYLRKVYVREPYGMVFEITTDAPGFAMDETLEILGSTLRFPPWLEAVRQDIERRLPALEPLKAASLSRQPVGRYTPSCFKHKMGIPTCHSLTISTRTANSVRTRTMNDVINGYQIQFDPGRDPLAAPLLLLHGTGGDESSLMPLGRIIAPDAPLLGVRGTVMEGSITRWFRRYGEGRLDLDDAARRADELAAFVEIAIVKLRLAAMPIAVGYSNGANMSSALLMRKPEMLQAAILMRAMDTIAPAPGLSLDGKPILFLNGAQDPLGPAQSRAVMVAKMRAAGADITEQITGAGHDIGLNDARAAREWLSQRPAQVA